MIGAYLAKRALLKGFDAMNRRDLAGFMSAWRDDGQFVYPGNIPESGVFTGKSAVEAWFRHFFERFPKIAFDVQDVCLRNILDLVGNNVAAVHWNVTLTARDGRTGTNSGVSVVTIRGGKVAGVRDFIFEVGDEFRAYWGAA